MGTLALRVGTRAGGWLVRVRVPGGHVQPCLRGAPLRPTGRHHLPVLDGLVQVRATRRRREEHAGAQRAEVCAQGGNRGLVAARVAGDRGELQRGARLPACGAEAEALAERHRKRGQALRRTRGHQRARGRLPWQGALM